MATAEIDPQDKKRQQIIEIALKRFAHFGLGKTTMNDIAADLNFSKALLYYYFPDKISLYAAVLENLFLEIGTFLDKEIAKANKPEQALKTYIDARQNFIERYFLLFDFNKITNLDKHEPLKRIFDQADSSEIKHLKHIIQIGIDTGEYLVKDAQYTAELLYDAIRGIRILYINEVKTPFGMSKDFFDTVSNRQKEIVYIFLKGLTK
ncbi:MAG: transcriptional regulator [Sphingobacteriales bacterium]|nr:transcriptional regulator [Sphingobacteriales bacterium]